MSRTMVGLLAAAGVAMSALVSFVHGDLADAMIMGAASATGLAAYLAFPSTKKNAKFMPGSCLEQRFEADALLRPT
jgi:hypothetical protein